MHFSDCYCVHFSCLLLKYCLFFFKVIGVLYLLVILILLILGKFFPNLLTFLFYFDILGCGDDFKFYKLIMKIDIYYSLMLIYKSINTSILVSSFALYMESHFLLEII